LGAVEIGARTQAEPPAIAKQGAVRTWRTQGVCAIQTAQAHCPEIGTKTAGAEIVAQVAFYILTGISNITWRVGEATVYPCVARRAW
jgi:hypothetical protein